MSYTIWFSFFNWWRKYFLLWCY